MCAVADLTRLVISVCDVGFDMVYVQLYYSRQIKMQEDILLSTKFGLRIGVFGLFFILYQFIVRQNVIEIVEQADRKMTLDHTNTFAQTMNQPSLP